MRKKGFILSISALLILIIGFYFFNNYVFITAFSPGEFSSEDCSYEFEHFELAQNPEIDIDDCKLIHSREYYTGTTGRDFTCYYVCKK